MKKIFWVFAGALLLSNLFLSTGCGEDTTDPVNELAPVVSITDGPTPESLVGGGKVTVAVNAIKGTKALKSLTVYQGTSKVSIDDLKIDGSLAAANPVLIVNPTDNMTWVLEITVGETAGTVAYTVEVADEGGKSDEASFDVTVETAIEKTITGATIKLWNAGGPVGTGGIDLEDGSSTGTRLHTASGDDSYLKAELRDMGIDSLAGSGDNWRRRIGGINGTVVRKVNTSSPDFDFSKIASKEAVLAVYNAAADLTETLPNWGTFKVSAEVQEGDVFAVFKSSGSVYYLVKVEAITETTTLGNNEDNYRVTIKY
jgi:hypothetical protein